MPWLSCACRRGCLLLCLLCCWAATFGGKGALNGCVVCHGLTSARVKHKRKECHHVRGTPALLTSS